FAVLSWLIYKRKALEKPGVVWAVFLIGYGLARLVVELYRDRDNYISITVDPLTVGQHLSIPMIILEGIVMYVRALKTTRTKNRKGWPAFARRLYGIVPHPP